MATRAPIVRFRNAQPAANDPNLEKKQLSRCCAAEAVSLFAEKGSPFASLPGILSSMMAAGATVDFSTPPPLNRALAAISFPRLQE